MGRRRPPRRWPRGGESISPTRPSRPALTLGAAAVALAAGLTAWLAVVAGPEGVRPVTAVGVVAVVTLVAALVTRRPEPLVGVLVLLGSAYAVILVIDDPPLDGRSAIVGAALLAIGELAHLSLEVRTVVVDEAGTMTRRIAWVAALGLLALGLGGAVLVAVDLLRISGIAIEVVGVAAALGAVSLITRAARDARRDPG